MKDKKPKIDRKRFEGVYASIEVYPPPPLVGGTSLIKLERVNGDCTVSELVMTMDEARSMVKQLKSLGVK